MVSLMHVFELLVMTISGLISQVSNSWILKCKWLFYHLSVIAKFVKLLAVWSSEEEMGSYFGLLLRTKMLMYKAVVIVIPILLYAYETWTTYQYVKSLEKFNQSCLEVSWTSVAKTEELMLADWNKRKCPELKPI